MSQESTAPTSQRFFSIQGKITLLITGVIALLAALGIWLIPDFYGLSEREALAERARAEASLLADAVSAALEFGQNDKAQETMQGARADSLISCAAVYDSSGAQLAHYRAGCPESLRSADQPPGEDRLVFGSSEVKGATGVLGRVAVKLKTDNVERGAAEMRRTMLLLAFGVLAFGIVLALWLSGRIARPLDRVKNAAERIAAGDISRVLPPEKGRDEVAMLSGAFHTMTTRLRELVRRIAQSADSLATAAAGMFSEVREQEALATQQTASLEEIRRTLETLSTAAEQVEVDADTVREMAQSSLTSSQQIAERTRMVSTHSERIGEILSLIQDIADRSDLLALNAALEGTKAGEVGRGFSLVAAEMRRLSEHVKDSVRDIRRLVADMREASHASVLATEEGIKLARETSGAAAKISAAVGRQREGTSQVKSSADEIVRVVGESLRGRAETTGSAEALLKLSQDLKESISVFRLHSISGPADGDRS